MGRVSSFVQFKSCFTRFSGSADNTLQEDLENICSSRARLVVDSAVDTRLQLNWIDYQMATIL